MQFFRVGKIILFTILVGLVIAPYFVNTENVRAAIQTGAYSSILSSGSAVTPARTKLNFIFSAGAGSAADNAGTASTDVNITGSTTGSVTTGVTLNNNQLIAGAGSSAIKVTNLTGDCTTGGGVSTSCLHVINFVIDGGGSVITTGDIKTYPTANYTCTINKAMISADQSGSITVDVWKANAAIPTSGNKISASAPVTLSSSQLNQNSALTGWTTSVSPNDVFGFNVATATTVTRVVGELWCQ